MILNLRNIVFWISFVVIIYSVHLLNTYKIWGTNENSVIALISGLLFLYCSLNKSQYRVFAFDNQKKSYYEKSLIIVLGSFLSLYCLQNIISPYPMDKTNSDVIPQINVLVNRFLSGEYPYTEIDFKTYKLFPTYLPVQWLPFSVAEIFGIDYRIFALVLLLISLSVFLYKINYRPYFYISSSLVFALLIMGMQNNKDDYFNCVENIIAAFYLAFTLSLLYSKKIWLQILLLSFCLFSRYSIILWVPLYFLYIFLNGGFYNSLKALGLLFLVFLSVYGIPFLIKDPLIFFKAYEYHTSAAKGEWSVNNDCKDCIPFHLGRGLGMAIFFYENQTSVAYRLGILQKIHLVLSLFSVAVAGLIALRTKYLLKKNIDKHFLIWSLALYLTIFYNFIQIPYHYLFSVPMLLYLVVFQSYFNSENK